MKKIAPLSQIVLTFGLAAAACAQTPVEPRNIVQLSASGMMEAQQDWLTLTLSTAKDGSDATVVQAGLRKALETALNEVKKTARPGEIGRAHV